MAANPIPAEDWRARYAEYEREIRERFQRARKRAKAFGDLSIEAVLVGVAAVAFIDWEQAAGNARRAQLEMDAVVIRRKVAAAWRRERAAFEHYIEQREPEQWLKAKAAYERAKQTVARLEAEETRIAQESAK